MTEVQNRDVDVSSKGLVGSFRRFGPYGVVYEVIEVADESNVLICVLETGETTPYPTREALHDPEADD